MKQINFQQEVLVFTQTSFTQKAFINDKRSHIKNCLVEKLERAFWNGLLNEMLPEIVTPAMGMRSERYIWQITVGNSSLLINMAKTPDIIDELYSINSYCFSSVFKMN